jgi:aspartate aminotransferase
VVDALKKIPGMKVNVPMGAFYVFPDVSGFFGKTDGATVINNPNDLSMYLLKDAQVAVVTGEAFGDNHCIRLSYATSDDLLQKAMARIIASLGKLR